MKQSDDDKKIDILIGDAVLVLLKENGPVTSAALIAQLNSQLASTADVHQQSLIRQAVVDVREGITRARNRNPLTNTDLQAVRHVAGMPGASQGRKKH